jgi:hypothetical protein
MQSNTILFVLLLPSNQVSDYLIPFVEITKVHAVAVASRSKSHSWQTNSAKSGQPESEPIPGTYGDRESKFRSDVQQFCNEKISANYNGIS